MSVDHSSDDDTRGEMSQKSKQVGSFREAVADIPDGSTIAFGGFAMPGMPFNLIKALLEHGAKRLTLVGNTTGGAQQPRMPDMGMLVENGQVTKVICAFTAATRPTDTLPFTKYYEFGECDAELVPQGTLAERMRAAGAGIPAFYTPTAVGTELAAGPRNARDQWPRVFAGIRAAARLRVHPRDARRHVRQPSIPPRATQLQSGDGDRRALHDRRGRRTDRAGGEIDADAVHCSGLFVHRLVQVPPPPEDSGPPNGRSDADERTPKASTASRWPT